MDIIDVTSLSSAQREENAIRLDAIESIDEIYKTYIPATIELDQSTSSTTTLKETKSESSDEDSKEDRTVENEKVKADKSIEFSSTSVNAVKTDDSSSSVSTKKPEGDSSTSVNAQKITGYATETPVVSEEEKSYGKLNSSLLKWLINFWTFILIDLLSVCILVKLKRDSMRNVVQKVQKATNTNVSRRS